jgi:hypothetical protein
MRYYVFFPIVLGAALQTQIVLAAAPPGRVVGWGLNISGQSTGIRTDNGLKAANSAAGVATVAGQLLTNAVGIAAGGHSLALRTDSTVVGWGWNDRGSVLGFDTGTAAYSNGPVMIDGRILSNVTAVAAGGGYSLAVKDGGTVVGWGVGIMGRPLNGPLPREQCGGDCRRW